MAKEPITPIPLEVKVDSKKANLGKELFFEDMNLAANFLGLAKHRVF